MRQAAPRDPLVGAWLALVCLMLIAMILIGGATRLTGSGLSITEWKPVTGALPPLSESDWGAEFDKYRQTTQFRELNPDIAIGDFKVLYWWEWGHRQLGRTIGLIFALGFFGFWATGRLKGRFWQCLTLMLLGGLQGAVGWWMVQSGLAGRTAVAPVNLATHLGLAFVILAFAWTLTLEAFAWPHTAGRLDVKRLDWIFAAALFVQILLGAIMAGSGAGAAFSDWPTIGGQWFPSAYGAMGGFTENLLTNPAAIQFNHRTAGYLVFALAAAIALTAAKGGQGAARRTAFVVFGLCCLQIVLGVGAIKMGAPLSMNLIHQGGAIALWLAAFALIRSRAAKNIAV
jgi:cytochrome c oxidase assembly protein subunit 15